MPELPEVETTCRGIAPHITHATITNVIVRNHQLRWPVPLHLAKALKEKRISKVTRRAKYLLIQLESQQTVIIHLGMSGKLRVLPKEISAMKHDHVDICFSNHYVLRYTDPRRFGAVLLTDHDPNEHDLLKNLGKEPLSAQFHAQYLFEQSRHKKVPIKSLIMDSKMVVGVGNIYAAEALFLAKIHPQKLAHAITLKQAEKLTAAIKLILKKAIKKGGTTLRDYTQSDGKTGYFQMELLVYGRDSLPCVTCNTPLSLIKITNRSTVFCKQCQSM